MVDVAKLGHAKDINAPSLTLRQRLSARVAKTGRRLLGLEADRTLLEDKLSGLQRQVEELLLHGRRTAQVESRIDQTHRQLLALDARVDDVQKTAKSVPDIANSTHQILNDLSVSKIEFQASIALATTSMSAELGSAQRHLKTYLDETELALQGAVAQLAATTKDLHDQAEASDTDNRTTQEHIKQQIKAVALDVKDVSISAAKVPAGLQSVGEQISHHHTLSQQTQADIQAVGEQISSHHALSQQTQADIQAVGEQLVNFQAQSKSDTGDQTRALSVALEALSQSLFAHISQVAADLRVDNQSLIVQQQASDGNLAHAQEKLDLLQARSQALTLSLSHVGEALAAMGRSNLDVSSQQSALLENLMAETFRRLEHQAADIQHSHKILLQQPIYTGPGLNAIVRVGGWDGHPIAVPTYHAGVVHGHYTNGAASGEPGVRAAIRALVKEGMCAIDVGAHVGVHSVIMGYHVGDTGRLICFEPDPDLAAALSQTMLMNGYAHKSEVVNAALADEPSRMAFFRTPHSPESTLFPTASMPERDTIDVDVTSLDWALPVGTRVDFLKIDAEGAEARIYRGMERVLRENHTITMIVEFAPEHFVRAGENPKAYLETAVKDGFSLATVDEPSGAFAPTTIAKVLKLRTCNLLLRRGE